jgi:hypothetical protein
MIMLRKADPARAVVAQIATSLLPSKSELIEAKTIDWSSATFTGARHEFDIIVCGAEAVRDAHRFVHSVGTIEFTIGGHIVADITAKFAGGDEAGARLYVEALTVEAD